MKEFMIILGILLCMGTYQMYITIAKHEPWAWAGVGSLTVTIILALYLDSRRDRRRP
jgi:hypothetical protein